MGSGSETRQRKRQVGARCTQDELAAIEAAAKAGGFDSLGEYIRSRCLAANGNKRRTSRRSPLDRQELARVSGLLGKYGSNLNQIARDANSGGEMVRADEVRQLAAEVREIQLMVLKALGRGRGHKG